MLDLGRLEDGGVHGPSKNFGWVIHRPLKLETGVVLTPSFELNPITMLEVRLPCDMAVPADCLTCLSTWRISARRHRLPAITTETDHNAVLRIMPSTHRRRDSTVELRRVGGVNTICN